MHLAIASKTSLLPCFSFLTRWPAKEGLDPDSVLFTLFSPPSFFLCLVGIGQFHLLHVSVSVLLVFREACLSQYISFPSCCPFCSPVLVLEHTLSSDLMGPLLARVEVTRLSDYFPKLRQELGLLKKSRVFVLFFLILTFEPPIISNLETFCLLVEIF